MLDKYVWKAIAEEKLKRSMQETRIPTLMLKPALALVSMNITPHSRDLASPSSIETCLRNNQMLLPNEILRNKLKNEKVHLKQHSDKKKLPKQIFYLNIIKIPDLRSIGQLPSPMQMVCVIVKSEA